MWVPYRRNSGMRTTYNSTVWAGNSGRGRSALATRCTTGCASDRHAVVALDRYLYQNPVAVSRSAAVFRIDLQHHDVAPARRPGQRCPRRRERVIDERIDVTRHATPTLRSPRCTRLRSYCLDTRAIALGGHSGCYISMPPMPPIPPIPGPACDSSVGNSATIASVARIRPATEAAFCSA